MNDSYLLEFANAQRGEVENIESSVQAQGEGKLSHKCV